MVNLGLKLAIASGFVTSLVLHGGGVVQQRPAASDPGTPWVSETFPDGAARSGARETLSTPEEAVVPKPIENTPSAARSPRPHSEGLPSDPPLPGTPVSLQDLAASSFAADVLRLSSQADEVDLVWRAYKQECGVRVSRRYDFGREWFSIWDQAAEPTIDAPGCGAMLDRLRQGGEKVRRGLMRTRATPHLSPGTEIGMLRWHALQWPQL